MIKTKLRFGYTENYKVLLYLTTTSTTYFDTGYKATEKFTVSCEAEPLSTTSNYWYGFKQANGAMEYNSLYGSRLLEFNWITVPYTSSSDRIQMVQLFDTNGNVDITINSSWTINKPLGTNFNTTDTLLISATRKTDGTARLYGSPITWYSFSLTGISGTTHLNLVPVKRASDNVVGLFDRVSNKFIAPTGGSVVGGTETGEVLTASSSVAGYQFVEYIQSTGTLWIDNVYTGFGTIELDCLFTNLTTRLLTGYGNGKNLYWGLRLVGSVVQMEFENGPYTDYNGFGNRHTYKFKTKLNDYTKVYVDDSLFFTSNRQSAGTLPFDYSVFRMAGYGSTPVLCSKMKVYGLKIHDENELLARDLRPAYRLSDNSVGLYDVVNNVFYGSSGTGTLLKGADVYEELTDADLYDVVYNHNVNNGSLLTIGTVASAELTFRSKEQLLIGDEFKYYCSMTLDEGEQDNFVQKGVFIVKEMTKDRDIYSYTCYDYISKFDAVVDDWYTNILYATTGTKRMAYYPDIPTGQTPIFDSLCAYLGITNYEVQENCNRSWYVNSLKFGGKNISGKYILGLCALIAGGYACADENGKIWLRTFGKDNFDYENLQTIWTPPTEVLDKEKYTKLTISDFDTPLINKVVIQHKTNGDTYEIIKTGTTGENIINILSNYWCFDVTQSDADTNYWNSWDGSFQRFKSYRPCTVSLLKDYGLNAGDYFYIKDYNGVLHLSLVMSKKVSASGVLISCVGEKVRDESTALKQQTIEGLTPDDVEEIIKGFFDDKNFDFTTQTLTIYDNVADQKITLAPSNITLKSGDNDVNRLSLADDGIDIYRGTTGNIAARITSTDIYSYVTGSTTNKAFDLGYDGTLGKLTLRDSSGTATLTKSDIDVLKNKYLHSVVIIDGSNNSPSSHWCGSLQFVSSSSLNIGSIRALLMALLNIGATSFPGNAIPCNISYYGSNIQYLGIVATENTLLSAPLFNVWSNSNSSSSLTPAYTQLYYYDTIFLSDKITRI